MGRKSAQFFGKEMNLNTSLVYDIWKEMGLVVKDKLNFWTLTEAGKKLGGKMSKSNYRPVPTFTDEIKKSMINYIFNKNNK